MTATCDECGAAVPDGDTICRQRVCHRAFMRRLRDTQRRLQHDIARMLMAEAAADATTKEYLMTQAVDLSRQPIPPTVGRIVLFTAPQSTKGQPYPAIITHVWSDVEVNLAVFDDVSCPLEIGSEFPQVEYDQSGAPGTWAWMPYQLATRRDPVQDLADVRDQRERRIKDIAGEAA